MTESNEKKEFKWLHLSDIHVGIGDQEWLWPTLKHSFYDDLKTLHSHVGAWDLVIFSGDLTQKGVQEEFDKFDLILRELWERFDAWGFTPQLIALPGNHDIKRAIPLSPELRTLRRWWEEQDIHREFFADGGRYRSAAHELFSSYSRWADETISDVPKLLGKKGLLPGDQSFEIDLGQFSLGIVTLNSTWLQIDGSDYEGKLHVDVKQLLAVTENDPQTWCNRHTFNLIVTHHPLSWLNHNSQSIWHSDINPPGRFDIHLFGHLHEAAASSVATGGSLLRNSIQAASTFGLAYTKEGVERLHGFSINRLTLSHNNRELRIWPRQLHKLQSGARKLGPDLSFELGLDNSFKVPLNDQPIEENRPTGVARTDLSLKTIAQDSREVLRKIQYQLPLAIAHQNVRKIEQRRVMEILSESRAVWLAAEWGMDSDGFLSSVKQLRGEIERPVYRIDLTDYKNRDQFLDAIRDALDCSFQQLCELISQSGDCLVLLDNFPVGSNDIAADSDIESLVTVILEYCPKLTIVLRCRRTPISRKLPLVQLHALDEADLRTYVLEHPQGGIELATPSSVGLLLRHTDGIPTRVDRALKELEVVTLPELLNSDSDISATMGEAASSPSLFKVINDLSTSDDTSRQRAYALLEVLSLFPQGEQLGRIKRFNPKAPFFPSHATELLDQALIEVTTLQGLDAGEGGSLAKTLVVPRPVRECVRDFMSREEVSRLNHQAAELYFGSQWSAGIFKFPTAYKFNEPSCGNAEIANASTIITRLLREAIANDDDQRTSRTIALGEFYLKALINGNHYNSAVIFCDDFVPIIPSGSEEKRAIIKGLHGRSLRMMGEHERAKSILLEIVDYPFSKANRQSILINLALCHESLNEYDDAKRVAEEIIRLNKHSELGLQARTLLIELDTEDPKRIQKLIRMENYCRKQGANIVANNIAIARANEASEDPETVRQILSPVVKSPANKSDYYNKTRAALKLARLSLNAGEKLTEGELLYLVSAYHFLFNERLPGMFDQCHDSLWKTFEQTHEIENLLTLFRHSSLYWRLRDRTSKEVSYLKKLSNLVGDTIANRRLSNLSREAAYYLVRASNQPLTDGDST